MAHPNKIGWSSYKSWEGPFYGGTQKVPRANEHASWAEKVLHVITTTEGGTYDAVNMYDRCIVTVGAIQWCENGVFGTSDMLGRVAEQRPDLIKFPAPFTKAGGKWRFTLQGVPVTSPGQMQALYLGGSTGLKGQWTAEQKSTAKAWCAAFATVFEDPQAQDIQTLFSASRLEGFVSPTARSILDDGTTGAIQDAVMLVYFSYAANLPAIASAQLQKFAQTTGEAKWSPEWVRGLLHALTYGAQIGIYPGRYNKIRPEIERLTGADLPDFSSDLFAATKAGWAMTVAQIQDALTRAGEEPGPIDGKMGPKTRLATEAFQRKEKLIVDGVVGPQTAKHLLEYLQ